MKMVREPYVAQLLPNKAEARLLVKALMYYVENHPELSEDDSDICYGLSASLYRQMTEIRR